MNEDDLKRNMRHLLRDALNETGLELSTSFDEVAAYSIERAAHLATITNDHGFDKALRAERNNVCMMAGLNVADSANALDQRIIGIIQGALAIAARALMAV